MIVKKTKKKMPAIAVVLLIFLIIYTGSQLFMYFWGVFTSFKTNNQFRTNMIFPTLPWKWEFKNYKKALDLFTTPVLKDGIVKNVTFYGMLSNTLIFCFLSTTVYMLVTWMMAYVTSQFSFRISGFIYALALALMVIPVVGNLPSALQIYKKLGLYDNWWYVVFGYIKFVGSNYLIFYATLSGTSKETKEAALVDGANNWTMMWKIVFPQTINMFFILYTMYWISMWNEYMTMIVWLPSYPSLAYGMYKFSTNAATGASWPPVQMAACVILMLPLLILFACFKDKIIGGVKVNTLK